MEHHQKNNTNGDKLKMVTLFGNINIATKNYPRADG
jgi:hypothetical protein